MNASTPKSVSKSPVAAPKSAPTAVVKAEPAAKPVVLTDANPFKYDARDAKRKQLASLCSPGWSLTNAVLTLGKNKPTRDTSVKGKIYGLVAAAGKDGITGAELVQKMRESALFADNPSKYSKNGIPVVPWCEEYIIGMTRPRFGFLNIKAAAPVAVKPEATAEKKAA